MYATYKVLKASNLYGNNAIDRNNDYPTSKELKEAMSKFLKNRPCPNCGGQRTAGKVIVEIGEVNFFEEVWKKGFFGKKLITQKFKTVWRVHNTYLEPSGFLKSAGRIFCESCGWEERGSKGVKWVSVNDIKSGNF